MLSVIIEDCSGDIKKSVTGSKCRMEELCGIFCFKMGCTREQSFSAEGEHFFNYLLLHNKSHQD